MNDPRVLLFNRIIMYEGAVPAMENHAPLMHQQCNRKALRP